MKKGLFYALCLGALAMSASCQKTEQNSTEKGNSVVFTAQFDNEKNVDVRTVLDKTGKRSLWNKDEIRVLNGENQEGSAQVYATMAENATSATFTIKDASASFTGTHFIAACPAAVTGDAWWNGSVDKTINKLWLKPEQTAVAGGYDPEAHIAVAYTEDTDLHFKNTCALLKFTVNSDDVTEVVVYTTTEGKYLSGNFSFDTTPGKESVFTSGHGDYKLNGYVKLVGAFEKGKTYYMSCLPVKQVVLSLEAVVNGVKQTIRTTSAPIDIERNGIFDLGMVEPIQRTLYLTPNEWANDSARFELYAFNGSGAQWFDFEAVEGKPYKVTFPNIYETVILVRMKPAGPAHSWDGKWNQTANIKLSGLPTEHNHFTITGWGPEGAPCPYTTSVYTE